MSIKARLLKFLDYKDIGQKKFETATGLANGFVNNIGEGISSKSIARITKAYPELDTNWLLTGNGEMIKGGLATVSEPSAEYLPKTQTTPNTILHVPIVAEAGFVGGYTDPVTNEELKDWALPGFDEPGYSFEVRGPSMLPTLKEGVIVVTSRREERYETIRGGYIYVIVTPENILIKRIRTDSKNNGTLHLISDNPEFKESTAKFDDVKIYRGRRFIDYDMSKKDL